MDIENSRLLEFLLTDEACGSPDKGHKVLRARQQVPSSYSRPPKRLSSLRIQNLKTPRKDTRNDEYIKKDLESIILLRGTSNVGTLKVGKSPVEPVRKPRPSSGAEVNGGDAGHPSGPSSKRKKSKQKGASKKDKSAPELPQTTPKAAPEAAGRKRPRPRMPRKRTASKRAGDSGGQASTEAGAPK
ncbi:ACR169Cp [Eremothecium gossypii ATCC 10895]|uniref:ACR169Cp n=1 Tax=Eremothecium gossypii (strain ATCC 10895 / CBS 109.51 / FGSC 9923 / NRRL Y-1056) TaxID=284811 RepID=Q75BV2_EREGS|nr:ACR169Cp [Eremothecium gossypii ATCC 10895]AAS51395.1 ACR169Cp [Eremothecium gossypii ATCC 10895]AEY95686.1 FACR169Cp [Eremothecium gossypii FDAG1]